LKKKITPCLIIYARKSEQKLISRNASPSRCRWKKWAGITFCVKPHHYGYQMWLHNVLKWGSFLVVISICIENGETYMYEMTKITISNQSHKSYRKYKSENGRTRTSEYIRGGIRCHGGVNIPVSCIKILLLHRTWSYFRFCRGLCCRTLEFVFAFSDYDYV
jgi:hypothetical protein